jgi:UDP-glucose:(heptosyl)LPS alpha-1,3-glucosyltransferase
MRIAIIQEHVEAGRGGAETSVLEMARHLCALGLDVTILAAEARERTSPADGRSSARPTTPSPENGPAEPRLMRLPSRGWTRAARTRAYLHAVERYLAGERFDVVHAVTPCSCADVYQPRGGLYPETIARSVARVRGAVMRGLVRAGRAFNPRQRMLLRVERELLERSDPPYVAAVSRYVERQVRAAFPSFPPQRSVVVFNGVEIEPYAAPRAAEVRGALREQWGLSARQPVALFLAHNFRLKGLPELLRAAALAPDGPALVVAGRGRTGPFRRMAQRLGVELRVRFVGASHAAPELLAAVDVLAHPTWYDPCSRVVLEALCCGVPVVTTRWNGAAEAMEPGRHGVVIDSPADGPGLAAALASCLDGTLRAALAEDRDRMRGGLSVARHARELLGLYQTITDARARPQRALRA